ncbi:MAG: hypothetical protein HY078_11100 [Elusimicrobia bacterium]|nr:hypothetical protein [Elusimicrobiota bacterium]
MTRFLRSLGAASMALALLVDSTGALDLRPFVPGAAHPAFLLRQRPAAARPASALPSPAPRPGVWSALMHWLDPQPRASGVAEAPRAESARVAEASVAADRMMVLHSGMSLDTSVPYFTFIANSRSHHPVQARSEGIWHRAGTLRLRVTYLSPEGWSYADGSGLRYEIPGFSVTDPAVHLPVSYWGRYAVYHPGDVVRYELEIENVGDSDATGLRVSAVQETFERSGGAGKLLPSGREDGIDAAAQAIKRGGRTVLKGRFVIAGPRVSGSNFEQTHVRVSGLQGTMNLYADLPQASIVDPPNW